MHVSPFFVWFFEADMHEITEANLLTSVSCLLIWTLVSNLDVNVVSGGGTLFNKKTHHIKPYVISRDYPLSDWNVSAGFQFEHRLEVMLLTFGLTASWPLGSCNASVVGLTWGCTALCSRRTLTSGMTGCYIGRLNPYGPNHLMSFVWTCQCRFKCLSSGASGNLLELQPLTEDKLKVC